MDISLFILSILVAFGMAVALVEKGNDYPILFFKLHLSWILFSLHPKLPEIINCTVCTSFWTALIADLLIFFFINGAWFLWPLTGFAALGVTWLIVEAINAIDSSNDPIEQPINEDDNSAPPNQSNQ